MRIAFALIDSDSWMGGYNYLLNLFRAIRQYRPDQMTPVLFCGMDASDADTDPFLAMEGVEVVRSRVFNRRNNTVRLLRALAMGVDVGAYDVFKENRIDMVFENATFYGWRFPLPAIAWMPDFQHRHLREQFGLAAYWRRELGFYAQVRASRVLMLSSEDARRDCEVFYPGAVGHTSVVRFAAPIPTDLIEPSPKAVLDEYRLPAKFFYLPNQFWKHKNHLVVIEALSLLQTQGCEVVVAASGNPIDPRHPEYLSELKDRIEYLGLQDNFRMLGLIPRRHVISLMRTCTALINPSYFEGWSSTVEEARTLGVSMLLSDIGVHREQMNGNAIYFSPNDAADLATRLQELIIKKPMSSSNVEKSSGLSDENVRRFACDFFAVVEKAANMRNDN